MESQTGKTWMLDESGGATRASISLFGGQPYINIRLYYQDKATKQGVTLNRGEWQNVRLVLDSGGAEMTMARDVYKEMFRESVSALKNQLCEGCSAQYGGQMQHQCVTDINGLMSKVLDTPPAVDVFEFVERAAHAGRKIRLVLSQPVEMFKSCDKFLKDELRTELRGGKANM